MARVVNTGLLRKIKQHGPADMLDLSACFNCGNCVAVCPLAEDSTGFPRRIIRMAQVGMEQELLASEDLWRCYACGECTETCPRQADPASFMAAARSYAISRYDFTGLAGLANRSAAGNLAVFALFSAVFSLLLISKQQPGLPDAPLFNFLPGEWIHEIGVALFLVVGFSAAFGMLTMFLRFHSECQRKNIALRFFSALPGTFVQALTDALLHTRFQRCDAGEQTPPKLAEPWHRRAWVVHACVMGGFAAMLLATTLDFLLKPIGSPVAPWYPMRLLGATGGLVCLYGLAIVLGRRWRAQTVPWRKSSFADWFFPLLLGATVFTGLVTEVAVYAPMGALGHAAFFMHVVLAMDLVALLPLTKFAHVLYRTLALALFAWRHAPAPETVVVDAQV
jgi:ferredoxin